MNFKVYDLFQYDTSILKVDRRHFADWHFGNFDKYIERAGCLYLRFETGIQFFNQQTLSRTIYEAVKIEEKPIDPKVFNIDTTLVKKYRF